MPSSTRRKFVAGNWKMFTTAVEAASLIKALKVKVVNVKNTEIAVCPPFTNLAVVADLVKGTNLQLGAQNLFWEEKGAFTGEISAEMLAGVGCRFVIVGHSERRQHFGETDETVNRRLRRALSAHLMPILCAGETLAQRQAGDTNTVVETQIRAACKDVSAAAFGQVTIAYEPVWAIGTGVNATPEQAQAVHAMIRNLIADLYGAERAHACRIQYGGSVKPANAKELMSRPDIDGALVGGASLEAESFAAIVKAAEEVN